MVDTPQLPKEAPLLTTYSKSPSHDKWVLITVGPLELPLAGVADEPCLAGPPQTTTPGCRVVTVGWALRRPRQANPFQALASIGAD